jgi:hypothetical protein
MNPDPRVWVAVNALLGRCAQLGDRGKAREVANLYVEEGILRSGTGDECVGRDKIAAYLERVGSEASATGALTFARHHITSVDITAVSSERAEVDSYFLVISDVGVDHSGRYRDVIVRQDGRWLFQTRSVRLDDVPRWGITR